MTISFQIEHAKSSRSTCKRCKYIIPENSLRLGKGSASVKTWFHLGCFTCKADDAEKFLKEHVVDNTNGKLLSQKKEFELILNQISKKPIVKKETCSNNANSKKNVEKASRVSKKNTHTGKGKTVRKNKVYRRNSGKMVLNGYVRNRDDEIVTKKFLHLCTDKPEAVTKAYTKYQSMSKSKLQDQLRRNNIKTKTSGNKEYYLMRVICMMRLRRSR